MHNTKSKSSARVWKQLLTELAFPLAIALLWILVTLFTSDSKDWTVYIKDFFATLFLVAWFTGQYFRVKKQIRVEGNFQDNETRIKELIEQLEIKTNQITRDFHEKTNYVVNHITGGDSYYYYKIDRQHQANSYVFMASVVFVGDFPLHGNEIEFHTKNVVWRDQKQSIAMMNHNLTYLAARSFKFDFSSSNRFVNSIIFRASSKEWVQTMHITKEGAKLKIHSQISFVPGLRELTEDYEVDLFEFPQKQI